MVDTINWPTDILKPQSLSIDLAHRSLRGPTASSGFTQVVTNSAGVWRVTFNSIPVYSSSMVKLWRALDSLIEGQLNVISLPAWDYPRSPSAIGELGSNLYNYPTVPHSDSTPFDDESEYTSGYTDVQTNATAAVGATTLTVTKGFPVTLEPGHRFSIDERLYQIRTVTTQNDTSATITIRPPLREFVTLGARLEFDFPRVKVRLMDDKAMFLPLNFNAQSFPTLEFIEDL